MKKIQSEVMKGFSFFLPFIVVATLLSQLSLLFPVNSETAEFFSYPSYFLFQLSYIVLAGFIAYAVSDRLALLPGLLGGILVVLYDQGFIAAIIIGLISGYIVSSLKYLIKKSPKNLQQTLTIVWIPLLSAVITYLFIIVMNLFMQQFRGWYESFFMDLNTVSAIIVCGLLAMLMAYDLGGPINKLAYMFAISTIGLSNNQNPLIPAVLIGGMVPPIAIGLFHLIFKNRFEALKDKNAWSTMLLGSLFISEAALPFYTLYGKKVAIPSLIGALISGVIVGITNLTSSVPHGGVLVFWTTSDSLIFFAALLSGAFASFIVMTFMTQRKEVEEI